MDVKVVAIEINEFMGILRDILGELIDNKFNSCFEKLNLSDSPMSLKSTSMACQNKRQYSENDYLTEEEVSILTKFSLSKLRNDRFSRKGISYFKIQKSIRYKYSDVVAFMEEYKIHF